MISLQEAVVDLCGLCDDELNEWEARFVSHMEQRLREGRTLNSTQESKLWQIARRALELTE